MQHSNCARPRLASWTDFNAARFRTAGMFWPLSFAGVAALPSNATTTIENFWEICILTFA
jgi:hypothetical protein